MLKITIATIELYDEETNSFLHSKEQELTLEHSLVSLSKWESKWGKPFLTNNNKTLEESADYIRCMTLTQNVNDDLYKFITAENIKQVGQYIEAEMTATVFTKEQHSINREIITAEVIYYWMISHNIPFECQKWHLNRLLTLINVCNIKNKPAKKMSRKETLSRNASLNSQRKQSLNTRG